MGHLLKHMFVVRVVILMIFCAHICTAIVFNIANFPTNVDGYADATTTISVVDGLTREMHENNKNEMLLTANAFKPKLNSTYDASTEKSLQILPVVLQRVGKSLIASDDTFLSDEQTLEQTDSSHGSSDHRIDGTDNEQHTTIATTIVGKTNALRFVSSLEPIVEFLRTFAKRVWSSYNWYQPELQLGKCMMKFASKQYPEMMRHIRMQNIGKLGYNLYSALTEFITNAMNGPHEYDESTVERGRIGQKVEQMTRHRPTRMNYERMQQQRPTTYARRQPQLVFTSIPLNASQMMLLTGEKMMNRYRTTDDERMQRVNEYDAGEEDSINDRNNDTEIDEPYHNTSREKRSLDAETNLFVGPERFPPLPMQESVNEDNDINLAQKPAGEIVEDLFDWEPVVLEGFGIDPKSIQKFSPLYCGKEYVFGFIKRVVQDFVMA